MDIVFEINVTEVQHKAIEALRNCSFPEHQANRSYYKQLPHMRALQYEGDMLVGYLGLNEHTNYGVAVEHIDDLFIKPVSGKEWANGHLDWLGYMY
ncbi:hypothetical protein ABMX85_19855 [Vibrio vulnificus]|uniref:hypothetical protein n=1 Tax=Vibrio vulnificus TaxID=672 RepID=UPI0040588D6D